MEERDESTNQPFTISNQKANIKSFKLTDQMKYVRVEMYLEEKIKRVYSYYQHYEILSFFLVIITHHADRYNMAVVYPFFILNLIINSIYFHIISSYSNSVTYNVCLFILKVAYPLPFMGELSISMYNKLYDFVFCLYMHRAYYIVQLISIYNYKRLRKIKKHVFSTKFNVLLKDKKDMKKEKQAEQLWNELYVANRKAAKKLSSQIIQQTIDDLFLQAKYLFHFKPFVITLFMITTSTMILSYLFQQSEYQYYNNNSTDEQLDIRDYWNSIYFISITIRTIGYGDIVPKTVIGKVIACISSMWGIIFTSISLYIFNQHFALTEEEKKQLNINQLNDTEDTSKEQETNDLLKKYQEIVINLSNNWDTLKDQCNLSYNQLMIDKITNSSVYNIIQSYSES